MREASGAGHATTENRALPFLGFVLAVEEVPDVGGDLARRARQGVEVVAVRGLGVDGHDGVADAARVLDNIGSAGLRVGAVVVAVVEDRAVAGAGRCTTMWQEDEDADADADEDGEDRQLERHLCDWVMQRGGREMGKINETMWSRRGARGPAAVKKTGDEDIGKAWVDVAGHFGGR